MSCDVGESTESLDSELRHSSFSNPSFASPTSQALHLRHVASRPWQIDAIQRQKDLTINKIACALS